MISKKSLAYKIADLDNLFFAWKKIENEFSYHEAWYDEYDFKMFKFNLKEELLDIHKDLVEGRYRLSPIILVPYPKKESDKIRQAFKLAVRDQVVWIATCNVLGPRAEKKMPAWSFGNRLFVPMWKVRLDKEGNNYFDKLLDEPKYVWKNGPFSDTSFKLYMPWKRSWPRFRHLLTATLKKMAYVDLDEDDTEIVSAYSQVDEWMQLRYLNDGYFCKDLQKTDSNEESSKGIPQTKKRPIFWASIDIETFYPSIKMDKVKETLIKHCEIDDKDLDTINLLNHICSFIVETKSISEYDHDVLSAMKLKGEGDFDSLPTGLLVSGWLANIFMLDIDLKVQEKLNDNREIAHFRYVDDHTFISTDPEILIEWIRDYQRLLQKNTLNIKYEKFSPDQAVQEYEDYVKNTEEIEEKADDVDNEGENIKIKKLISLSEIFLTEKYLPIPFNSQVEGVDIKKCNYYLKEVEKICQVDPNFPAPLMTDILKKVSHIGSLDLELLSNHETEMVLQDLQTLVVTEFPDEEIKEDTRVSFAGTMLSRILLGTHISYDKLNLLRSKWLDTCDQLQDHILKHPKLYEFGEEGFEETINLLKKYVFGIPAPTLKDWKIKPFHFQRNNTDSNDAEIQQIINQGNQIGGAINDLYNKTYTELNYEAQHIYNLLLKAANKVPEKVRIWIRTVEFCILHCPEKLDEVLRNANSHKDTKLHRLECAFIESRLYGVITNRLIQLCWEYYFICSGTHQEHYNQHKDEIGNKINLILKLPDPKYKKRYTWSTRYLFEQAKDFAQFVLDYNEDNTIKYLIDLDDPTELIFILFWLIDGNRFEDQERFNILDFLDIENFMYTMNSPLGKHVLLKAITSRCKYDKEQIKLLKSICDNMQDTGEDFKQIFNLRFKTSDLDDVHSSDKWYSLINILKIAKEANDDESKILREALSSDIICLKIIEKAITEYNELRSKDVESPERQIRSLYLCLNKENILKLWKTKDSEHEVTVKFMRCNDTQSFDMFNISDIVISDMKAKELYHFGVLMYELFSGDTDTYWLKARPEYMFEWPRLIKNLHDEGKIGSFCERLLSGCLLPTARELITRHKVTSETVKDVNNFFAPLYISGLPELQKKIHEYLSTLELGVSSLGNNKRVELRFIDLK